MAVHRLAIGTRSHPDVITIFNFETEGVVTLDIQTIANHFFDPVVEYQVDDLPEGSFLEVMYHNGVIDPAQGSILEACASLGLSVVAAKVSKRYYGPARNDVYFNRMVHVQFTSEPHLDTLRPRGNRKGMELFDLTAMSDDELISLGNGSHPRRPNCDLSLNLVQMKKCANSRNVWVSRT